MNHRVLARQALGLPSQDDAVAGCSRKCCACSRNAGGSDKKAAKGTATGFAVRPHEAQPARKLQQWQLRERRQRWQAEREEEKRKAKYRKQHRMPKPRRRLGDLLDAPVDSEDPYVVVARRPCCASMGYDWRRKPYQQHIVGCCGKCFNCCCRAGCCKVIAIRTTLSVKLVKVLRAERAERLRVGLLVRVCPRARFAHAWRGFGDMRTVRAARCADSGQGSRYCARRRRDARVADGCRFPAGARAAARTCAVGAALHSRARPIALWQLHGGLSSRELEELDEARRKASDAAGSAATSVAGEKQTPGGAASSMSWCGWWKRSSPTAPGPAAATTAQPPPGPYVLVTLHASAFEDEHHTGGPSFTVSLPVATLASATVADLKRAVEQVDPMKAPAAALHLSIFVPRSDAVDSDDGELSDGDGEHKGGTWVTMDDDDTALAAYGIEAPSNEVGASSSKHGGDGQGTDGRASPQGGERRRFDVWLSRDPAATAAIEDGPAGQDSGAGVSSVARTTGADRTGDADGDNDTKAASVETSEDGSDPTF